MTTKINPNSSYLPEIQSCDSNIEIKIDENVEEISSPKEDIQDEIDPKGQGNEISVVEDEEEILPVKPRKKLTQKEIFKPPVVQQVISNVTGKPKKKMSEKQLAHLAKARAKGLATRQRNKKLREEGRAEEISKKTVKENVRIQEKIIKEKEKITNEEIENITFNAIQKYEILRKSRKIEKKKKQEEEKEKNKHMEVVNNHLNNAMRRSTGSVPDVWDDALKGLWT